MLFAPQLELFWWSALTKLVPIERMCMYRNIQIYNIKSTRLICNLYISTKGDKFLFSTSSQRIIFPNKAQSLDRAWKSRDYESLNVPICFDIHNKYRLLRMSTKSKYWINAVMKIWLIWWIWLQLVMTIPPGPALPRRHHCRHYHGLTSSIAWTICSSKWKTGALFQISLTISIFSLSLSQCIIKDFTKPSIMP